MPVPKIGQLALEGVVRRAAGEAAREPGGGEPLGALRAAQAGLQRLAPLVRWRTLLGRAVLFVDRVSTAEGSSGLV